MAKSRKTKNHGNAPPTASGRKKFRAKANHASYMYPEMRNKNYYISAMPPTASLPFHSPGSASYDDQQTAPFQNGGVAGYAQRLSASSFLPRGESAMDPARPLSPFGGGTLEEYKAYRCREAAYNSKQSPAEDDQQPKTPAPGHGPAEDVAQPQTPFSGGSPVEYVQHRQAPFAEGGASEYGPQHQKPFSPADYLKQRQGSFPRGGNAEYGLQPQTDFTGRSPIRNRQVPLLGVNVRESSPQPQSVFLGGSPVGNRQADIANYSQQQPMSSQRSSSAEYARQHQTPFLGELPADYTWQRLTCFPGDGVANYGQLQSISSRGPDITRSYNQRQHALFNRSSVKRQFDSRQRMPLKLGISRDFDPRQPVGYIGSQPQYLHQPPDAWSADTSYHGSAEQSAGSPNAANSALTSNVNGNANGSAGAGVGVSVNALTAAHADDLEDQEKRLFLEQYRYAGQQTKYDPPTCKANPYEPLPAPAMELPNKSAPVAMDERIVNVRPGVISDDKKEDTVPKGEVLTSRLRGDAPEFVPVKRQTQPSLTIVTSWPSPPK